MPKGIPKKKQEEVKPKAEVKPVKPIEVIRTAIKEEPKPINGSNVLSQPNEEQFRKSWEGTPLTKSEPPMPVQEKPKLEPLGPGQKYFEAADGEILIGEADKSQLWYRKGNGGNGCWINPRR